MTLVIEGVPTEISRDRACDLIRSLGIDPDKVISIRIEPRAIVAEVYSVDEQGRKFVGEDGHGAAKHTLSIKIT